MSTAMTAKFEKKTNKKTNKKTKHFFEDILAKFDPIWTEASGFESQLSEKKKYVHVCVYTLLWKYLT